MFLVLGFAMQASIYTGVNGVRFYTAFHVFLYGVLGSILRSKQGGFLKYIIFSPLIHFSFLIPVVAYFVWLICGRKNMWVMFFWLASYVVDLLKIFGSDSWDVPKIIESKFEYYMFKEKEILQNVLDNVVPSIHIRLALASMRFGVLFSGVYFLIKIWGKNRNSSGVMIICFGYFTYGIANMFSQIATMQRFFVLGVALILAGTCVLWIERQKISKHLCLMLSPGICFWTVMEIRNTFDYIGLAFIFGNPLFANMFSRKETVIELIGLGK
jgi:hypothetical protein